MLDKLERRITRVKAGVSAAINPTGAWRGPWAQVELIRGYRVEVPLPVWAECVGMNASGCIFAYDGRPFQSQYYWEHGGGRAVVARVLEPSSYDWRMTLVEVDAALEVEIQPEESEWLARPVWARWRR